MLNFKTNSFYISGPLEQFDVYWTFNFFLGLFTNLGLAFWINILTIVFVLTFILYDLNQARPITRITGNYNFFKVRPQPTTFVERLENAVNDWVDLMLCNDPRLAAAADPKNYKQNGLTTHNTTVRNSFIRDLFQNVTGGITLQLNNYFTGTGPYPFKALLIGVFLEIVFLNYLGLFPNNEGLTSTFILPFFLAFLFVGIAFLLKYYKYGIQAWSFFVPSAPLMLLGLIVIVELISYAIKLVSLSGRLFANIFSGHVLLAILTGATFTFFTDITTVLLGLMGPALIIFCVFCLEFFIAFLQAYVFANLGAMYLGDAVSKQEH